MCRGMERHVVVAYVALIQTLERWLQEKQKKKGADVGTFQYHGPRKLNACQKSSEIAHKYGIILDVISVVQCVGAGYNTRKMLDGSTSARVFASLFWRFRSLHSTVRRTACLSHTLFIIR
jgi:hypothetical protein